VKIIKWVVNEAQKAVNIPVSIDSSNIEILTAGLSACDHKRGKPMVNSVSLERLDAIRVAATAKAVVVASAAGRSSLPSSTNERLKNIAELFQHLDKAGFHKSDLHIDPLVFPISTDGANGVNFLNTVRSIRTTYGSDVHIIAGLSNVSFGMPNRKLINQVFAWLAADAGADGGIVDPSQINKVILNSLNSQADDFKLAKALLLGEDEYGMKFIEAFRGGEG
jgi:5-methyltetrahydrofolate--homocysteine methyltransferase